jgi:hypothetical protein
VTLINHLKKFFSLGIANIFLLIFCKYFSNEEISYRYLSLYRNVVLSPRLARHLSEKGYSILPRDTMKYLTHLLNQILARRREHLERRNDFLQIMIDHEEEMKYEEQNNQQETFKKSKN